MNAKLLKIVENTVSLKKFVTKEYKTFKTAEFYSSSFANYKIRLTKKVQKGAKM
jgi:hypothetical protein